MGPTGDIPDGKNLEILKFKKEENGTVSYGNYGAARAAKKWQNHQAFAWDAGIKRGLFPLILGDPFAI